MRVGSFGPVYVDAGRECAGAERIAARCIVLPARAGRDIGTGRRDTRANRAEPIAARPGTPVALRRRTMKKPTTKNPREIRTLTTTQLRLAVGGNGLPLNPQPLPPRDPRPD